MKIYVEKEIKNPFYLAVLDNGVTIYVYDGYAQGNDGKIYKPVINEIDNEVEFVGWSCEK